MFERNGLNGSSNNVLSCLVRLSELLQGNKSEVVLSLLSKVLSWKKLTDEIESTPTLDADMVMREALIFLCEKTKSSDLEVRRTALESLSTYCLNTEPTPFIKAGGIHYTLLSLKNQLDTVSMSHTLSIITSLSKVDTASFLLGEMNVVTSLIGILTLEGHPEDNEYVESTTQAGVALFSICRSIP